MFSLVHTPLPLLDEQNTVVDVIKTQCLSVIGGSAFLSLAYPLYRGFSAYVGQTEHLRTTLNPTRYHRSQLKLGGAVHASFQILGAGGGIRSLYYGFTPLLLTFPIVTVAQSAAVQFMRDSDREESTSGKWKFWSMAVAISMAGDVITSPFRSLHYAMATTPASDWAARPSMRQILAKHPNLWRAGLFPFMTAPALFMMGIDSLPIGKELGIEILPDFDAMKEEEVPRAMKIASIGAVSLAVVSFFGHVSGITGIRMVVDAVRPSDSVVPRYNSWTQATKLQLQSGWRTICAGILSATVLSVGLTIGSTFPSTLSALIEAEPESEDSSED